MTARGETTTAQSAQKELTGTKTVKNKESIRKFLFMFLLYPLLEIKTDYSHRKPNAQV